MNRVTLCGSEGAVATPRASGTGNSTPVCGGGPNHTVRLSELRPSPGDSIEVVHVSVREQQSFQLLDPGVLDLQTNCVGQLTFLQLERDSS